MTIAHWPSAERPREKLLNQGTKYLSDAELIAIFLRTGIRGKTALDIARELLNDSGGLKKLLGSDPQWFFQKPGIGKAKLAILKAAIELGRRYLEEPIELGEKLGNSTATKRFLQHQLHDYPYEVFACLFLDTQHRMLAFEELFKGTLTESVVYPREIIKRSLAHNAANVILAHNHPSGNTTPSQADQEITRLLKEALGLVDICLVDHIIVGINDTFSFAEAGLL